MKQILSLITLFLLVLMMSLKAGRKPELLEGIMLIKSDNMMAIPNFTRLNRGGWS